MKYEKLSKNYTKTIIIGFIIIIIIGSVLVLNITKAKYKTTVSVPIVSGTVKYDGNADLNVVAMYKPKNEDQEGQVSEWDILTEAPGKGYDIDENQTKCTIGGEEDINKTIKISYDGTSVTVTGLTKPNTKCNIYFVKKVIAGDTIIANFNVINETPNFSKTTCATGCDDNNSGLYKEYDDFGESYYFRGTIDNNWVKFGKTNEEDGTEKDIYWRIIRINGDGSIRLIYAGKSKEDGSAPDPTGDETTALTSQVIFNASRNNNAYVGFQYTIGNAHGYKLVNNNGGQKDAKDSDVLTQLNIWFKDNLEDEWANGSGRIDINAGFCNDRSNSTDQNVEWKEDIVDSGGIGSSGSTYYGAYLRLRNHKQPTFKCSTMYGYTDNRDKDYFTYIGATGIKQNGMSNIITGTKSLEYPVGLITLDEVAFAGAVYGKENSGFWLNTGKYYWTMSPNTGYTAYMFYVNPQGRIPEASVSEKRSLRPVINLKSNTKFTFEKADESKGTSTNPYIVSN